MAIDLAREKGISLDRQLMDWRELVRTPLSKLDADAFTRIRVILMNGIESEAVSFQHTFARLDPTLQETLAIVRRAEHQQATLVNWLLPPDLSPIETTIAYEQVAIEVTAHVARNEPDPYLAQVHRFGLLEDFDHLYVFSALADRLYGLDANAILNGYTDIRPGRPTVVHHRHPHDDLRLPYDRRKADPLTKIHALTILAGEQQTRNYYMNIGPTFADPLARQLYAEIASIEEQHVTQYESIIDPTETLLERWLLHEVTEVWNYAACAAWETDPRVKEIWERFAEWELGHLQLAMRKYQDSGRDPFEVIPTTLPEAIAYESHRDYVRQVLADEVDVRPDGRRFVRGVDTPESLAYRERVNRSGSPSAVASGEFVWGPGTELASSFRSIEGRAK